MENPVEITPLVPPPVQSFPSMKAGVDAVNNWAKSCGYGVAIAKSKLDHNAQMPTTRKVWLRCSFGRASAVNGHKRKMTTCMTGCEFKVTLTRERSSRAGTIPEEWQLKVEHAEHNHEATLSALALPVHRCRDEQDVKEIQSLSKSNTTPHAILNNLIEKGKAIDIRDIYNERSKMRKEMLQGKTPVQALLQELEHYIDITDKPDSKYYYRVTKDAQDHLHTLFFAHPKSIELLRSNYDVLLLDCTYKTNKFRMPLLHISGITCLETSFEIAYCFLPNEQEPSYQLAIKSLFGLYQELQVMPSIVITDKEQALKNALRVYWPEVPQRLPLAHLQQHQDQSH